MRSPLIRYPVSVGGISLLGRYFAKILKQLHLVTDMFQSVTVILEAGNPTLATVPPSTLSNNSICH